MRRRAEEEHIVIGMLLHDLAIVELTECLTNAVTMVMRRMPAARAEVGKFHSYGNVEWLTCETDPRVRTTRKHLWYASA